MQESCKVTLPVHPGFFCHLPIGWKQLGEKDDWRGFGMQITLIVHEHDGFELVGYINTDEKKKNVLFVLNFGFRTFATQC